MLRQNRSVAAHEPRAPSSAFSRAFPPERDLDRRSVSQTELLTGRRHLDRERVAPCSSVPQAADAVLRTDVSGHHPQYPWIRGFAVLRPDMGRSRAAERLQGSPRTRGYAHQVAPSGSADGTRLVSRSGSACKCHGCSCTAPSSGKVRASATRETPCVELLPMCSGRTIVWIF